jgi:hypothetical protein
MSARTIFVHDVAVSAAAPLPAERLSFFMQEQQHANP